MAKDIKFNIRLNIDGKNVVVQASESVKELQRNLMAAKTSSQRLNTTLIRFNQTAQIYTNVSGALSTLGGIMSGYIAKANMAATAQTKLTTVMQQRMGATEADTAAINKAVAAQTELGIVGGTVQKSGLQQLATFSSQRATLETLLPAMNNLLAQQKGLNATSEDAVGVANLMGKALMGNVGALTRVGITLTDQQKELIKTGDEYTRAKTLAQAITDNVGEMNKRLAETDAGQVKKAQMAFASIEVTIGKVLAPLQGMINQFSQIGLALGGIGQLYAAMNGLTRAIGLTTAASSLWHARTVMSTAVTNLFSAALNGASVGATTLKFALRGLMSATVVGAAITLLGVGLEKLISYFTSASDKSGQLKQSLNDASDSFEKQREQALAPTLAKYQELQAKWKELKSVHEKNEFLKANKTAFEQLGVSINNVGTAEDFFVKNTKAVQDAMYARAEAAAAAALAEEEMRKALAAEAKVKADRQKDKANYKKQNHTGKTGNDLAVDALVDSGAIKVTSKRTQRDEADLKSHQDAAKGWLDRSRDAANRANKGLKPYQQKTTTAGTGAPAKSTSKGSGSTSGVDKQALQGSLDWYEQKMQALRKQMYASNDEATAAGLQAQYEDLETKSKAMKIRIGLEEPETQEVKTYMEQLQGKLAAAQKELDNATTIEARVAASAKVDEIQAEIDTATKGEVSIKAAVEPSYIQKGSVADKRQSYQNAQSNASQVQQDFEIGIIGEEEAKRQIDEINASIQALGDGMKPIKLDVDTKDMKALKSLFNVDLSNFDSVAGALSNIKGIADPTTKGLAGVGTACSSLGSAMQQLGTDSAGAKAGMVMAAIGQIALSFAQALASCHSWVEWLAFGISGAATMISLISTVNGFATGGIVGGNSTTGDKIPIRVNSGEMILTKAQQARLFAIANGNYLPKAQEVKPRVGSVESISTAVHVTVGGKLRGNDMELMASNTKRLGEKIGRRY